MTGLPCSGIGVVAVILADLVAVAVAVACESLVDLTIAVVVNSVAVDLLCTWMDVGVAVGAVMRCGVAIVVAVSWPAWAGSRTKSADKEREVIP